MNDRFGKVSRPIPGKLYVVLYGEENVPAIYLRKDEHAHDDRYLFILPDATLRSFNIHTVILEYYYTERDIHLVPGRSRDEQE